MQPASLEDAFERALEAILARVSISASNRIAIAFSGGLDSAALLNLANGYADKHGVPLCALHVHHGLSASADEWMKHCEQVCVAYGVPFDARRVTVSGRAKHGTEQAARTARYAALGVMCQEHQAQLLLTAHHEDDQVETVLLQLLRGSGIAGLCGMEQANDAEALLGQPGLSMGRPLLGVSRAELEHYVAERGIRFVEDESNSDLRYTRNVLRHAVMPVLSQHFPGYRRRIVRSAEHAQSAQQVLTECAARDYEYCAQGTSLDLNRVRQLSPERMDNLFRYWFAQRGIRMPSTAWLSEMREQLLQAREDALVRVVHPDGEVRRHRNRAYLIARLDEAEKPMNRVRLRWQGEAQVAIPALHGVLHFDLDGGGLSAAWLRERILEVGLRAGGETLKPGPNRPSRSLKHHYQALDIPSWERSRLPLVFADGRLIYAAGIGLNWSVLPPDVASAVAFRWEADAD